MKFKSLSIFIVILYFFGFKIQAYLVKNDFCKSLSSTPKCDPSQKYRPINGVCNNLKNPYFGAANTKFKRMLRTRYADNVSEPPKSVTGSELPSARLVSLAVFGDKSFPDQINFTLAQLQFIQLIAHDLGYSLSGPTERGCCLENGQLVDNPDASCLYIPIPSSDKLHKGQKCMDFVRTLTDIDLECPNTTCDVPAQQINGATASIDLSPIYGSSEEILSQIRSFKDGMLRTETRYNMTWPPHHPNSGKKCFIKSRCEACYFSPDSRINQSPMLSIVSILFIREHNRIAKELKKLNPHWSDEILFQEARRINIAQYQHIDAYEWFPAFIDDEESLKLMGFQPVNRTDSYSKEYNPMVDSSILNEYSSAMFRLPHTLIEGYIKKLSDQFYVQETVRLSDTFNRPKFIEGYGTFESFLRGMTQQSTQAYDFNYDKEVRSYLFRNGRPYGSDLKAIDIQRGRDHGIGSYNDLREFCQLPRAVKWEDFGDIIDQVDIDKMKQVYAHVDDVDLNVGASLEKPFNSKLFLGYTYVCMLSVQLPVLRTGDRFWYDFDDPAAKFTPKQLEQLRKASMSRIICDNGGNIGSIQKNAFRPLNKVDNKLVKCSEIPVVDLKVFKE